MAKDTIYLCNFRVSVDGDWLCLEELNDVKLDTDTQNIEDGTRDPVAVERMNLLEVFKLTVKELLDISLSHGRTVDDTHAPLQQFFLILEHILLHRVKPRKSLLQDKRDFWPLIERIEKCMQEASDITISVRELPKIKTPLGRCRAWLRLALMQKRLPDYFRLLVDKKDKILTEFYEEGAAMLEEEAQIVSGLLVGLNVIDFNIGLKDDDLDRPVGVIDFSLYLGLRDPVDQQPDTGPMEMSRGSQQMAAILDQKNYLEELNRHLSATVSDLQQKLEKWQTAHTLMREDITIAKINIIQLQQENSVLRSEKEALLEEHRRQLQTAQEDIDTERATYNVSRQGLNNMYQDMEQMLRTESLSKQELEKGLEQQLMARRELELTLRLLEKDSKAKMAIIQTLKSQLDHANEQNLLLKHKLQT